MSPALVCRRQQRLASPFKQFSFRQSSLLRFFSFSTTATNNINESKPSRCAPPPIQVLLTESAGRGVFATRKIGAGELIHTAQPIVSHPSLSSIHSVCYFCLKKLATGEASVKFCSNSCRNQAMGFYEVEKQADWSAFDEYCRTRGLKYPLLVRRMACMVISGVASANSFDILQPAILSPEMTSQMEEEFGLLRSAFLDADMSGENTAFLTKQWYIDVLARIRINAFRIELVGGSYEDLLLAASSSSVDAEAAVGNAIYMLPSFYNHDCDPNAHILWIENVNARLKALRDIDAGEELRICYIDASMNYGARQTLLSQGFGFQCHCLRCLSND